jgi:glycosyltransferase involved in cell wall biosynthesis
MVSICITCKNRSKLQADRKTLYLLPHCIDSIIGASRDSQTPLEVVVSDWDSTDWPLEDWLPEKEISSKIIPIDRDRFSLGYGRNIAAQSAFYNILFFLDADMLLNKSVLEDAVRSVEDGKMFFPICSDMYTNEIRHGAFGNVAMSRENYNLLGEWSEKEEWGGEDLEYFNKCKKKGLKVSRKIYPEFIHQWHPKKTGWEGEHSSRRYQIHPERLKRMEVIQEKKKKHKKILEKRAKRSSKNKNRKGDK